MRQIVLACCILLSLLDNWDLILCPAENLYCITFSADGAKYRSVAYGETSYGIPQETPLYMSGMVLVELT